MDGELIKLKNLGNTSVNLLHAVGIKTESDLKRVGPVNAYKSIKERGFSTSKVLLYALQGALLDTHWNELDSQLKKQLVIEAELEPIN